MVFPETTLNHPCAEEINTMATYPPDKIMSYYESVSTFRLRLHPLSFACKSKCAAIEIKGTDPHDS
jgi:hypothetical protein